MSANFLPERARPEPVAFAQPRCGRSRGMDTNDSGNVAPPSAPDVTTRCFGYPKVASRRLKDAEVLALHGERRAQLVHLFALLALPVAAPTALVMLAMLLGLSATLAVMLGTGGFLFATGIAILQARDGMRRRSWTAKDLAAEIVFTFAGPYNDADPAARFVLQDGPSDVSQEQPNAVEFELLAASGRLWSVNGERRTDCIRLPAARVANLPGHAQIAAQWVRPIPYEMPDMQRVHAGTRPLSSAELAELRRHSRQAWRTALVSRGFWILLATVWLSRWILGEKTNALLTVAVVAAAMAALRVVKGVRTSRVLRLDVDVGVVEIFRFESEPEGLSPPVELLPVSRIPWSEAGVPTAWRSAGSHDS